PLYSRSPAPAFSLAQPPRPPRPPLSLHDALPISRCEAAAFLGDEDDPVGSRPTVAQQRGEGEVARAPEHDVRLGVVVGKSVVEADRKSTRLNSSHDQISYAVFCLKKTALNAKFWR